MPTTYTSNIINGISFNQFLLTCAKSFGACVHLCDDDLQSDIKFRVASDYHTREIEKQKTELEFIENLNHDELEQYVYLQYTKDLEDNKKALDELIKLKSAYENMLMKVYAWKPPSDEYNNLKDFMINQILESIRFDCCETIFKIYSDKIVAKEYTPNQWKHEKIGKLKSSIDYHINAHAIEISSVEKSNSWISCLLQSLETIHNK